jgi:membrane-anchored glycerophosphoryl diester phosphodiesterase (GDPDase)
MGNFIDFLKHDIQSQALLFMTAFIIIVSSVIYYKFGIKIPKEIEDLEKLST